MKTLTLLAILALILSCNQKHPAEAKKPAIERNQGNKWQVNQQMKPFILQGEKLVNDYITHNDTDYKTLAANLSVQNDQLIESCTMKGKSHDELHKWLHPHLELVKKLEGAGQAESQEIVVSLEQSYRDYHQYFE